MYRLHLAVLFPLFVVSSLLSVSPLRAQDPPQTASEKHDGTAPRTSAAKYRAHFEKSGFSIGAELVTKKEVSRVFAADLNRCCLVLQVAVYPKKDEPIDLSLVDFALLEVGTDKPMRPESPSVVAARLEKKKNPNGGVDVTPVGSIGYETGVYVDPVTGQPVRVHGVSTSVGVGVSTGSTVPPEIVDHDRQVMEWELSSKCLQEGKASIPIAGYLYFPISKTDKDAKYTLTYSGKSEPIVLTLP
jgi:hypothetical protein